MKILHKDKNQLYLELSQDEMKMIRNALNETCHGMPIPDFQKRVGFPKDELDTLIQTIKSLLSKYDTRIEIRPSSDEFLMMINALKETCQGIHVREFHTRTGCDLDKMESLLHKMQNILE